MLSSFNPRSIKIKSSIYLFLSLIVSNGKTVSREFSFKLIHRAFCNCARLDRILTYSLNFTLFLYHLLLFSVTRIAFTKNARNISRRSNFLIRLHPFSCV